MAKSTQKIEQWQLEDAARLKKLFADRAPLNQAAFGAEYKIGNQGYVWQLLNGRRPLNIKAAQAFATGLGITIDEFSPTLAAQISDASAQVEKLEEESEHVPIRVVDAKASAGKGKIVFSEDHSKTLMFRKSYLAKNGAKAEDVFGFEVDGESMIDLHIINGAVVLANTKGKEPISKRVYILWIDGQLFVKQLIKQDGMWYARSHNAERAAEFPDIQISIDDRIVGRAFWCGFGL